MMSALPKLGTREYDAVNEKHVSNPEPGDYWHEMFCPYLVVLARVGDRVIIYRTRKDVDHRHWTWDTTKPEMMSLADLRKKVTYGNIPGFVADVAPRSHKQFAEEFAERTASSLGKGDGQ
jgi:hypothetical protein